MMTGRAIPATATGTTRTTPAVETTEREIPEITARKRVKNKVDFWAHLYKGS